jgi:TonB family protein
MGKIVKYCSSCDEGFAEKFTFCPDCGGQLQAFEMNPLASASAEAAVPSNDIPVEAEPVPVEEAAAPIMEAAPEPEIEQAVEAAPVPDVAPVIEPATIEVPAAEATQFTADENVAFDDSDVDAEYDDLKYESPAAAFSEPVKSNGRYAYSASADTPDDGYHVTVIQEKNGERNGLFLASSVFMIIFVLSATVYSLFSKDLGLNAINDNDAMIAYLGIDVPMPVEPEPEVKKDKNAGGGGGGGKNEPDPVNQGDLANQSKNPIRPPDVNTYRSDNFELKTPVPTTQGNKTFEQKYGVYGDPNSRFGKLSNGPGSGGGIGIGNGTGQGSGNGTGAGSGSGSGYGAGDGDLNGDGSGSGRGGRGAPPPPPTGVTTNLAILSKPRPGYTDAARTNNVQGTVRLRVTFNANGSIGSISPVSGLPNGLTEQAIAAARQIRFEPKKINGVPVSVTKVVEYSFSIY